MVFVIEDNAWGISVAKASATCISSTTRAAATPGVFVENNDPDGVFRAAGEAIERARAGGGPTLIEIETYRPAGHFMGDGETYRPEGEKDGLMKRIPFPATASA